MTTVIEDNQLTLELKELCGIAKSWLADLTAQNTALGIQHRRLETVIFTSSAGKLENIAEISGSIRTVQGRYGKIKKDIEEYLDGLEPLINRSNQNYQLALIENHALLEHKISALFYTFIDIREKVSKLL